MFKGTRDAQARRVLAPRRRARRARERLHHARQHRLFPADPGRQAGGGDEAEVRPLRQQPVARRRIQARDRGGQGGAAHAHRGPAARPAVGSAERGGVRGLALPPPGRRLDERPRGDDAAGRARLLSSAGTCRPMPPWWWPATWTPAQVRAPGARSTTAASRRGPCRRASRAASRSRRGMRRIEFKAPAEQAYVALAFKVPQLTSFEPAPDNDDALALDGAGGGARRLQRRAAGPRADAGPRPRGRQRRRRQRLVGPRPAAVHARRRARRRQDARAGRSRAARRGGEGGARGRRARPN